MNKQTISIGIPCYNEELNISRIYRVIKNITKRINKYNYHFIFIDNGSSDGTRKKIESLAKKDKSILGVFLSRNFGAEASAFALVNYARGDALISIPCDFQDPPELIPKFLKKWEEGYDIVVGIYKKGEDDLLTSFLRKSFYGIFKKISSINIPINASGVGLLNRKALNALNSLPEKYRFYRGLRSWIGFKTAYISYERKKRLYGKSSYHNFFDYFKHAERGLFGFSYLVLDVMTYCGFLITLLSFLFIIAYVYWIFVFGNPINASIPLMLGIVFFGGVQLLAISIIGKYIQVIVEETKNRPIYIVEDTINLKK